MKYKVAITIFCLTYNHVQYIRDTFEGFLNQNTQFPFNIFVYDDASTDGTSDIVREYKDKYPDMFNIYISEKNLYRASNREVVMNKLYKKYIQGKYVAWCEGDDYWINPNKLQLQVEYMESNPGCSMTAHGSYWLDCQNDEKKEYLPFDQEGDLTEEEIILQPTGNLSTASLVMRREIFMRDDNYPRCGVMDRPLQLYALYYGKIHYFPYIMSVYRYMHEGSWSIELDEKFKNMILHCYDMVDFLEKYNAYTKMKYKELIRKNIIWYLYICVYRYRSMNEDSYIMECEKMDASTGKQYSLFLSRQCRVFKWIKGSYVFDKEEVEAIRENKYVVIMGTGEFSKYVKQVFENNNLVYTGYVVTVAGSTEDKEHAVWKLSEYPYEKKKTLVVIGIHQKSEQSVLEALESNGFDNYMTPLWIYE